MAKITIDKDRCKGCLLCISHCPRGLIKLDANLNRRGIKPVKFVAMKSSGSKAGSAEPQTGSKSNVECLGCLQCALICPDCCITVYR